MSVDQYLTPDTWLQGA